MCSVGVSPFSQPLSIEKLVAKNYPSIGHLPGSRLGSGDRQINSGQSRIATLTGHQCYPTQVIVSEKLDGSNVRILKQNGQIYAVNRSGYRASGSPYEQHQKFAAWVREREQIFQQYLKDGERLAGEWLLQAHGTRYQLPHEPLAIFDWFVDDVRLPYLDFERRIKPLQIELGITIPKCLHFGEPIDVASVLKLLGEFGHHGAIDPAEGAVWRVETQRSQMKWQVDFLAKYVRAGKVDGCYLPNLSACKEPTWNNCLSTTRSLF